MDGKQLGPEVQGKEGRALEQKTELAPSPFEEETKEALKKMVEANVERRGRERKTAVIQCG